MLALLLSACDGGSGGGSGGIGEDVPIVFTATRLRLEEGGRTDLIWEVPTASSVRIEPEVGSVEPSGRRTVAPEQSITYRLSAELASGRRATRELTLTVEPSAAVRITASDSEGPAPLTVTFDPRLSSSTAINRIFWDFEGDGGPVDGGLGEDALGFDTLRGLVAGTANYDVTGQPIEHTFDTPGIYTTRVRVLDGVGNAAESTFEITVENASPEVRASASVQRGGAPLDVRFSADAVDAEGVERFDWDFDGDGTIDESTPRGSVSTRYESPGEYAAAVSVIDVLGAVTTVAPPTMRVEVDPAPTPSVALSIANPRGAQPHAIELVASARDVDRAEIASFDWDFDGDGRVDAVAGGTIEHVFDRAGTFYPRVSVTGAAGERGFAVGRVDIEPALALALDSNTLDPTAGGAVEALVTSGGPITLRVSVEDEGGQVVATPLDWTEVRGGETRVAWNGRDQTGTVLPPGAYRVAIDYNDGERERRLPTDPDTRSKIFYPSGWGAGGCRYSEIDDCGTLTVSENPTEPFASNPTRYEFTIPQNARMTAYLTIIGSEDIAPATFFRSRVLARGSYAIDWFGEGTDGALLPSRAGTNGYLPAIWGVTLGADRIVLTHGPTVDDLVASPSILFPLDPTSSNRSTLRVALDRPGDLVLSVDSMDAGVEVRREAIPNVEAGSDRILEWDGRDNGGEFVAPGGYRISVRARDAFGIESLPARAVQRIDY